MVLATYFRDYVVSSALPFDMRNGPAGERWSRAIELPAPVGLCCCKRNIYAIFKAEHEFGIGHDERNRDVPQCVGPDGDATNPQYWTYLPIF